MSNNSSILKKIANKPDDQLADDDHPDRDDISKEEAEKAVEEIVEAHKDDKPVERSVDPSQISRGIIDSLNEQTTTTTE